MLKEFIQSLKRKNRHPGVIDLSKFEDPIAKTTSWSPVISGGKNFCSHKLVEIAPHRMELRATLGAKLFCMFFVFGGIVAIGLGCYDIAAGKETSLNFSAIFPFLIGFVFAGIGVGLLYFSTKPIVFDKHSGHFWKGRKDPDLVLKDAIKIWAPLEQIHALQIIAEYCFGSESSSYYSYELNIVLKDGERINVVDHSKLNKIREDANVLSNFLGKPVWNAT